MILVDTAQQIQNLFHEKNFEATDFDFVHPTFYRSARWFTRLNSASLVPKK